jgi:glyoxylate/hydroxypyruvate reductase
MNKHIHIALTCPKPEAAARYADAITASLRALGVSAQISTWSSEPQVEANAPSFAVAWAPTQDFIDAQSNATAIFSLGAGVDSLLKLKLPSAVPVIRLEDGGMGPQMADYVSHAVMRFVRQFDVYEAAMQRGEWRPMQPRLKEDFTIGVMGLGVLGEQVASRMQQLGYPVVGWARTAKQLDGIRCYAGETEFDSFLAATRILVCMLPLTPETTGIMNRTTLAKLQPDAYVINVARGAHLVEADLCSLIDSGHIAGATLDVFQVEPLPAEHPFRRYPQIKMTPHVSAQTLVSEAAAQIARKMVALTNGEPVSGVIDWSKAY